MFLSEINSKINISQHTVDKVDNIVENIVNRIVAGKTLQQRLRRNREFIINQSRLIIEKMIKNGNSIPQMAATLKRILKIDKNKAFTIAITEAHRIKEESTNKGYEEAQSIRGFVRHLIRRQRNDGFRQRDSRNCLEGVRYTRPSGPVAIMKRQNVVVENYPPGNSRTKGVTA